MKNPGTFSTSDFMQKIFCTVTPVGISVQFCTRIPTKSRVGSPIWNSKNNKEHEYIFHERFCVEYFLSPTKLSTACATGFRVKNLSVEIMQKHTVNVESYELWYRERNNPHNLVLGLNLGGPVLYSYTNLRRKILGGLEKLVYTESMQECTDNVHIYTVLYLKI